jgi:hypothetical protein
VRDDRPWAGPDPPAAVYFYSPDRRAERPAAHLNESRGVVQVDGYAGFETLTAGEIPLGAHAAEVLRRPSGDRIADRGRGLAPDRRASLPSAERRGAPFMARTTSGH